MTKINYVNDKFVPAPLPDIYAPRHELLHLYGKASANRLTVVCAPAGFGKTVSTLLWIKDSKRKSVWVGLDEYDNAPFVFYKLFCTGILSLQPDNVKMQEILYSKTFHSSPVEHTISLLMEFAPVENSYALIIDDLHTITNSQILKSLPFILKRMPHAFDILILSRNNLSEEFTEFVESRKGTTVTAKDLAFSAVEIQKYYSDLGRNITRAQARAVLDITGGWVIGINALSKSEQLESDNGGGQILENYISKNIWEKWDKGLREFMLHTSVTKELDAEICGLLTEEKNTEELLDRLAIENSFVIRISPGTYRYHHLFSDFLRSKMKERPDINVYELNLKIANLYYERQDYFAALDYYVRAKNHNGIILCISQLNTLYQDFSVEEWLHYFTAFVYDKLSDEFIKENISLVMEYAWANFLNGNAEAALHYIDIMNDYIASDQNMNSLIEHNVIGFASIIGFSDFRRSVYQYSVEFAQWLSTLPIQNDDDVKMYATSITQNFPIMHRSIFDCLEIVLDMDTQLAAIKDTFGMFFPNEGDLFCYCVRAGLYYERDELEKAYETIILAQSNLKKEIRFEFHFCVFMLLSQILGAMEKQKESESAKMNFNQRIKTENALYLHPNYLAVDVKHHLWDADKGAAEMWFEQFFVTDDDQFHFYKLCQYFTSARAYIVLRNPQKAMVYIEKLKKLSSEYRRPLDIAEACVLQAALEWTTGLKKKAVQTLEDTLLEMQTFRAVRIIADEGAAVLPILKKIITKASRADYQGQLDRNYLSQIYLCAYKVSKKHPGITAYFYDNSVKLSKQQKHILTLLSQGYKNTEIVSMTGLTINTLKSHTKAVYLKLNVNNAADAILKAKSLGIIELGGCNG